MVHIAGQAPFDVQGQVVGKDDFVAQFTQVMSNLKTAIEGGRRQTESVRGIDNLYHQSGSVLEQQKAARYRLSRGIR